MKLTLRMKALGLAAGAAVLPAAVVVGLTWDFKAGVVNRAGVELRKLGKSDLAQIARQIYALCEATNAAVEQQLIEDLGAAQATLARTPGAKAVEAASQRTGGSVTVLRRTNEAGDMEVVATTVADPVRRTLGTSLSAADSTGGANPSIAAILRGQTYRGPSEWFERSPVTACAPLRESGRISGMVCVGARTQAVEALRGAITGARLGQAGYVVVIGAKGNRRGRFLVAVEGRRDGESIWESQDPNGDYFVQRHVANALQAAPGEIHRQEYPWKNPGDAAPRTKLAAEVYFEPWDWFINVGTFEDDYYEALQSVDAAFNALLLRLALAAAALLAAVLWLASVLSGRLAQPLAVSAEVAKSIAAGEIRKAREQIAAFAGDRVLTAQAGDEGHELIVSLSAMAANLDSLIGQVRKSTLQVNTSALEIAASARELEATVAEQAASTREVSATSKEISATSTDLLHSMGEVGDTVAQAAEKTETRQAELQRMEQAMRDLLRSTGSISSRLGVISDRANKISRVVATINKVSDQTSLLALNAAIEAEKAGEFGKGFSVVAREISRLADQTAVATQDIESVVREMQSSVSSGVMEMDRFSKEVGQCTGEVSEVAQRLSEVIHGVLALGPQFEAVSGGMEGQTTGAQQISEAIGHLSQGAEQTKQSLHEFKLATEQLNGAVLELQAEVTRFQITV